MIFGDYSSAPWHCPWSKHSSLAPAAARPRAVGGILIAMLGANHHARTLPHAEHVAPAMLFETARDLAGLADRKFCPVSTIPTFD